MSGQDVLIRGALLAGCRAFLDFPCRDDLRLPPQCSEEIRKCNALYLSLDNEGFAIELARQAAAEGYRVLLRSQKPYTPVVTFERGPTGASKQFPCVVAHVPQPGTFVTSGSYDQAFEARDIHPMFALAPGSLQELGDFTILAFELADKYQATVCLVSDAMLSRRQGIVDLGGKAAGAGQLPAQDLKVESNDSAWKECCTHDADILVVTAGAATESAASAVLLARQNGIKVAWFRPVTLRPFPTDRLRMLAETASSILVVERGVGYLLSSVRSAVGEQVSCYHISSSEEQGPSALDVLAVLERTRWAHAS